jgi:hypothetical protein
VIQFNQLTLFPSPPSGTKNGTKQHPARSRKPPAPFGPPRSKRPKLELNYLAFDDDYFWELIRKDYISAWKYVDRMNRTLN